MAFWSKFAPGHWILTEDDGIVARAVRRTGRWVWEVKSNQGADVIGLAETLDAAMLAVGRVRRQVRAQAAGKAA
jgi:hypothetical protein